MVVPRGIGDLYRKYRPRRFDEVKGHKEVVASIKKALSGDSRPQAFLLSGESGAGKTTTARIMALSLNCTNKSADDEACLECTSCKAVLSSNSQDLVEVNAADHRGIDNIRSLCSRMALMPMQLKNKVFILDEAHQLTNDAQSSLLKELEEAPKHVFIILCSTHPQKLLPTVKNRCQKFKFDALNRKEMIGLLEEVATLEGELYGKEVYEAIADSAMGSPRAGLVNLQQVMQLDSKKLPEIQKLLSGEGENEVLAFELARALGSKKTWPQIVEMYNQCISAGPPAIGMMMAGFFRGSLLRSSNTREAEHIARVMELFVTPFPDGKLGENMLVLNLFKAHAAMRGPRT